MPLPPQTITVEGILIRPGDRVVLMLDDDATLRTYAGISPNGDVWLKTPMLVQYTTLKLAPGPFCLDQLRHPNFLAGFIREVDAAD